MNKYLVIFGIQISISIVLNLLKKQNKKKHLDRTNHNEDLKVMLVSFGTFICLSKLNFLDENLLQSWSDYPLKPFFDINSDLQ